MWRKNQLVGVRAWLRGKKYLPYKWEATSFIPSASYMHCMCSCCSLVWNSWYCSKVLCLLYSHGFVKSAARTRCHLGPAAQLMVRVQQPDVGSLLSTTTRGLKTTAKHVPLPVIVTIATTSRRREGKKYQQPDVYWVQNYLKF